MSYQPPIAYPARPQIVVTTTFNVEGYRIRQYLGLVRGIIVRSPTIAQGFLGGLKSIIGGQIGSYTQMCEQARQQSFDLLIDHAAALGANAIVGLRYNQPSSQGERVAMAYGTAVKVEKIA